MFEKYLKKPGEDKNQAPKIFAVILAVILWLYVMNEQNPPIESWVTMPLEARNAATSYVITEVPDSVRVKVRGPRSIVAGLINRELTAYVDVKGLGEGRHNLKVTPALPSNLEAVEVSPERVQIQIETVVSREVPVEARLTGAPAKGTLTGKVTIANEKVTIEGPKHLIETVEKVMAPVDLAGKNADIAIDAQLIPVNTKGREVQGLTIYPEKTRVTVVLMAAVVKKTVDVKPVTQGELPAGFVIQSIITQPEKVEVSENTPGKTIEKLDAVYTEPVMLAGINKDTNKEVRLQLPEGVSGTPPTVTVTIKIGPR
ncbi:CdaR family protein [Sporomusa sphaeroides]|uniref:YbbR-like protein n=2 Tax=Sporomusa TaxID=2375 RepID=A0ABM9W2E9_9FIRM|nr:CdaR family protein [Sporomusa sphaeroides]OLS56987.1 YbbR-like protein [Sporomusa sphaeroides DSM 2875]CVK18173.1 YbbR-like protein [Sporomusa sphaeroides DSM 2875]SCM81735.1 conserved hypothetical protein [uncultured Sporomusa sp.]